MDITTHSIALGTLDTIATDILIITDMVHITLTTTTIIITIIILSHILADLDIMVRKTLVEANTIATTEDQQTHTVVRVEIVTTVIIVRALLAATAVATQKQDLRAAGANIVRAKAEAPEAHIVLTDITLALTEAAKAILAEVIDRAATLTVAEEVTAVADAVVAKEAIVAESQEAAEDTRVEAEDKKRYKTL